MESRFCQTEIPRASLTRFHQQTFAFKKCAAIIGDNLIGPCILPLRLICNLHLRFLKDTLLQHLEDVRLNIRRRLRFQHSGMTPRCSRLGSNGSTAADPLHGPARSPDLASLDYLAKIGSKQMTPTRTIRDDTVHISANFVSMNGLDCHLTAIIAEVLEAGRFMLSLQLPSRLGQVNPLFMPLAFSQGTLCRFPAGTRSLSAVGVFRSSHERGECAPAHSRSRSEEAIRATRTHARLVPHRSYAQGVLCVRRGPVLDSGDWRHQLTFETGNLGLKTPSTGLTTVTGFTLALKCPASQCGDSSRAAVYMRCRLHAWQCTCVAVYMRGSVH
ncbi:hypothetical protein PR048_010447 [Dryococelus australis]|uniref:Uncharacterized protein n=1 Tax=Dryococelus australis TaxID=614101 RepID=A0ABQ9I2S6_9NEOP|nr:hypothetical protein PR048_010447 [Dryococelus australis]